MKPMHEFPRKTSPLRSIKPFSIMVMVVAFVGLFSLVSCNRDAANVSHNLSYKADNFEIDRRIVFDNGITGEYMLVLEGRCSIEDQRYQLEVVCQAGPETFKKHFLGLSDNISYFAEQLQEAEANRYHYAVVFKPQSIIPDIDFRGSTDALGDALTPDAND